jgi:REP element-mobilizing transposase RayT
LKLSIPNAERIFYLAQAFQDGMSVDEVFELTKIDRWFLRNVQQIVEEAQKLRRGTGFQLAAASVSPKWRLGFQSASRTDSSRGEPDSADGLPDRRFYPFDAQANVTQSERHLPHWQQTGVTYFVTFRLTDSIAANILEQWREERTQWLKHHPPPWDWKTAREYMRRFEEEREQWLDQGHGSCLLRNPKAAQILAESLRHFDGQRYVLDAFVVMPNHMHALVKPLDDYSIAKILHSWKSFSANAINHQFGREGALWMAETFDTIVRDKLHLEACRAYIAKNPGKAALASSQFLLERREALVIGEQAGSLSAESGWKPNLQKEQLLREK